MKPWQRMIFFLLGVMVYPAYAQVPLDSAAVKAEHARVEAAFETIVNRFVEFFQTKQKLLYKYENSKSKTGVASYVIEYTCKEVNYGVNSSNNTIIPYLGFIKLSISRRDNRSCGTIPGEVLLGASAGWDNVEAALANNKETCFKSIMQQTLQAIRLDFEFKNGQWVFKQVVSEPGNQPEPALCMAFGKPVSPAVTPTEETAVRFNQKWAGLLR